MKIIDKTLFLSGALIKKSPWIFNALLKIKPSSLRIIYYHVVSDQKYPYYFDNKSISKVEFEGQIRKFKRHYEIISLNEALKLAEEGKSLKRKLVITFDDGFIDNYTVAAPILKELKCPATFYLISNCIDNKDLMWRNKLVVINRYASPLSKQKGIDKIIQTYGLKKQHKTDDLMKWSFNEWPMAKKEEIVNDLWQQCMEVTVEEYLLDHKPYMSTKQIKELVQDGFEIGCHSMSHPVFSRLNYDDFKLEICGATKRIKELTGIDSSSFSYPFGQRASRNYEEQLMAENISNIKTFLGTRNKLNNGQKNIHHWERDNLEFPTEIALSRFFLVSAIRSIR